jgi:sirohydrochlorin ferrochelatase
MELAEPTIAQGFLRCVEDGASEVIVHPYMLSPGRHAMADIPSMVADAAKSHPNVTFTVSQPLGLHKKLGELIFLRAGIKYDQKES